MTEARLSDNPDWGYLLREFYELYRFLPSGGSVPIRAHDGISESYVCLGRFQKTIMASLPPAR
jgi:hypothetical protein